MLHNVKIIGGKYGGRVLDTPKTRRTHPMGARIRNAMFNSIGQEVEGAKVLDVYAGTGALGLEALSRGADSVIFVEKDRIAGKAINNNITMLSLSSEEARLVPTTAAGWLGRNPDELFDIIFLDPPYHEAIRHLSTVERFFGLLKPGALMVLSKPDRCEDLVKPNGIVVVDNRSYSDATLTYYRRKV